MNKINILLPLAKTSVENPDFPYKIFRIHYLKTKKNYKIQNPSNIFLFLFFQCIKQKKIFVDYKTVHYKADVGDIKYVQVNIFHNTRSTNTKFVNLLNQTVHLCIRPL